MKKENKVIELSAVNKSERAFQAVNDNLKETRRNLNKVSGDLKKQTAVFGHNEKAMKSHSRTMSAVMGKAKGFAAVAGAALVAAFGVSAIKDIANYGDKLDKLGLRIGTTADYLSEMKFVSEQTGVNFETFGTAMQRATRRINEAAHGTGEARAALAELGLDAKELDQLPLDQKFNAIADAIDGLGSQADKVRIAMKLFDTEGVALVQTMTGGSAAINELRSEAKRLGVTLTDLQADNMAAMNDATNRLSKAVGGLSQDVVARLSPAITAVADDITEWITGETELDRLIQKSSISVGDHKTRVEKLTDAYRDNRNEINKNAAALKAKLLIEANGEKMKAEHRRALRLSKASELTESGVFDELTVEKIASGASEVVAAQKEYEEQMRRISAQVKEIESITAESIISDDLTAAGERLTNALKDPVDTYKEEVDRLNILLKGGYIEQGVYNKAMKEAEALKKTATSSNNGVAASYKRVADAVSGASDAIADMDTQPIPEAILNPFRKHDKPAPDFLKEEADADRTEKHLETIAQAERTATAIKDTFSGAAKDIITNFNNLEDVANNVLNRLGNNIIDSLFGSLGNTLFGNGDIGHSGIIGGVFDKGISAVMGAGGGVGGSILGSIFGGFFADGGHLSPGKVGIVGEEGPELIYGGTSGKTIVPLDSGGGAFPMFGSRGGALSAPVQGGGNHTPIIINNHIKIDSAVGDDNLNRMIESKVHSGVAGGLAQYDKALPSRIQEKNAREG